MHQGCNRRTRIQLIRHVWSAYGAYGILGYLIGLLDDQSIPEYPGDAGAREWAKEMHVYPDPGAAQGSVG